MRLKSLLIGSAAFAAAATGARAADPIIIPEPEPMAYVRVCDVYGAGFFYIPGTETCLKIGGMVRYQVNWDENDDGWRKLARVELNFDARSETELGTLGAFIKLRGDSFAGPVLDFTGSRLDGLVNDGNALSTGVGHGIGVRQAIISLGGLSMGVSDTLYDAGISGEFDSGGGSRVHFMRYTFVAGNGIGAALALEEADSNYDYVPNVVARLGVSQGWGSFDLYGAYDATAEEFAVKAIAKADLTDRIFAELIATYESGISYYSVNPFAITGFPDVTFGSLGAKWSAGGLLGYRFSPRLKASIGAQYFGDVGHGLVPAIAGGDVDVLRAGATIDYTIVENFDAKLAVNYIDVSGPITDADGWAGFVRFQRNF